MVFRFLGFCVKRNVICCASVKSSGTYYSRGLHFAILSIDVLFPFFGFSYKVLLNPSTTDVVCTTSAEALAMGKIVVCANHPSNEFFMQFPNCRTYDDGDGFVKAILKALADEPAPLTDAQRHELSWEAATERFLRAAELDTVPTKKQSKTSSAPLSLASLSLTRKLEDASALVHFVGTGFLSSQPDEEQCKELGLKVPPKKTGFSSGKWI